MFCARIDQHIENSRSSSSKHDFILDHKSVMTVHSFNEINGVLARIDQHIENMRSSESKYDFILDHQPLMKLHFPNEII